MFSVKRWLRLVVLLRTFRFNAYYFLFLIAVWYQEYVLRWLVRVVVCGSLSLRLEISCTPLDFSYSFKLAGFLECVVVEFLIYFNRRAVINWIAMK